MKTSALMLLGGILVLGLAGIAIAQDKPHSKAPAQPAATKAAEVSKGTNAPAPSDFPVIGYLKSRDRTVTIKVGPKGPLYSVTTAAGKVLCDNASLDQLRAEAPELHQFIKSAIAATGKGGIAVDASVRFQKREHEAKRRSPARRVRTRQTRCASR